MKELQVNFKILVPDDHKYIKQFRHYFQNIEDGNAKAQSYERFLFDLLLDSPRCEHCLAPLENNNVYIKNHINYYHFDIKIQMERYSYLDMHKYIREVYKYPYIVYDNCEKKTNVLCPIPDCGAQFVKMSRVGGQLQVSQHILYLDHFVRFHSGKEKNPDSDGGRYSNLNELDSSNLA